jgi:prepilin-type N-terminal cleavage/methylation domain-containing protein
MHSNRNAYKGFSLIELVIVVVIIGIIGAIAIPRMSRGTAAAADSALTSNLATLRSAIDLFAAEHNQTYPALATISDQLTKLTNSSGGVDTGTGKAGGFIYGPYLRKVPPLPVGAQKGNTGFTDTLGTAGFGWVYNAATGEVKANCPDAEVDETGKKYNTY